RGGQRGGGEGAARGGRVVGVAGAGRGARLPAALRLRPQRLQPRLRAVVGVIRARGARDADSSTVPQMLVQGFGANLEQASEAPATDVRPPFSCAGHDVMTSSPRRVR